GTGKACTVDTSVHHKSTVGGKDHVGQTLDGCNLTYPMAQAPIEFAQGLPLSDGTVAVHAHVRVHPRVDRVLDREVRGAAHQIVPASRRVARGDRSNHETSPPTVPGEGRSLVCRPCPRRGFRVDVGKIPHGTDANTG